MRGLLLACSIGAFMVLTLAVIGSVLLSGNALVHANDSLAVIDSELTSVNSHADPLTFQINKVNTTLTNIEASLHPIHDQATTLNGSLSGTNSTLVNANGLVSSILGHAGPIEASLNDANVQLASEANEVGVSQATAKVVTLAGLVPVLNGILTPAQADLFTTSGLLAQTNTHLASVCSRLSILPIGFPCP